MNRKIARRLSLAALALLPLATAGCFIEFFSTISEELTGNVSVVFINNTSARAALTFGSYDPLQLDPPAPANVQQTRIEANTTSQTFSVVCRRTVAIATQDLVDRVVLTNGDDAAGFDREAFNAEVNFSNAPADSDAAALPTVGIALGREVRVGVDYKCGDQLIFTFVQDAEADGGFRIDFSVIPAEPEDN